MPKSLKSLKFSPTARVSCLVTPSPTSPFDSCAYRPSRGAKNTEQAPRDIFDEVKTPQALVDPVSGLTHVSLTRPNLLIAP